MCLAVRIIMWPCSGGAWHPICATKPIPQQGKDWELHLRFSCSCPISFSVSLEILRFFWGTISEHKISIQACCYPRAEQELPSFPLSHCASQAELSPKAMSTSSQHCETSRGQLQMSYLRHHQQPLWTLSASQHDLTYALGCCQLLHL